MRPTIILPIVAALAIAAAPATAQDRVTEYWYCYAYGQGADYYSSVTRKSGTLDYATSGGDLESRWTSILEINGVRRTTVRSGCQFRDTYDQANDDALAAAASSKAHGRTVGLFSM